MQVTAVIGMCVFSSWATAQLTFENPAQELHASADGEKLTCDFPFANKGGKTEEILTYEGNCSCIAVQLSEEGKRIYAPGEKGVLRAVFDLGTFSGTVDKHVAVRMMGDAVDAPSITLTVKIHIPVLVNLEPKSVEWSLGEEKLPKKFKVMMNDKVPVKVTSVTSSNADFVVSYSALVEGKEYEISVVPAVAAQNSPGIAMLRVETDCTNTKQKNQMAFALIRSPEPAAAAAQAQGAGGAK